MNSPAPTSRRPPTEDDVTRLARVLRDHQVDYLLIGGAAMALHGFPRMTKDIDVLLPVDRENNRRLLQALGSLSNGADALAGLRPQFMDRGHSTSLEGEIAIDLLYVAASKAYEELKPHMAVKRLNGVPVSTLDVEGMLLSKQTDRAEDVPDRLRLERLRNALFDAQKDRRIEELVGLARSEDPATRVFARIAAQALASEAPGAVNWKSIEDETVDVALAGGLEAQAIAEALCAHSPGAVYPNRQAALRKQAARRARELKRQGKKG